MKLAYSLCLTVSVCTLAVNNCVVASPLDTSHIHTQHTLGLKPIASLDDSYNLAAAVFLPDFEDSIGFGGNTLDDDVARRDNCSGFALASCPAHAKCSKCTFDSKYKITGCDTDYKQSGNACIAKSCAEINASYKAEVPSNQICTITNTSVRTCYSSCRAVNTSGYPLDTCPSNAVCTSAPECGSTSTTKGNCSPVKQKVTGCTSSTQKVNSAATACIDKDDTCPTNYYKSCETGTQGDPKYTERGSACYQCKPACMPLPGDNLSSCTMGYSTVSDGCDGTRNICNKCQNMGAILYSDRTVSTEYIDGKTPIAVVVDCNKKYAMALNERLSNDWQGNNNFIDIPTLANCTKVEDCPADGKDNTAKIIAYGNAKGLSFPAVEFAYNYQPEGCTAGSWCGKGNWYLPAVAQVPYFSSDLVYTFRKIPEQYQSNSNRSYYNLGSLTSNEYSAGQIWSVNAYQGNSYPTDKYYINVYNPIRAYINY